MSAAKPALITNVAPVHAFTANRTARPRLSVAILLCADLAALSIAAAFSIFIWSHLGTKFDPQFYLNLWPVLLLFPIAYAASGLYPGFGRNPASELRSLCAASSVVYPAFAVTIFLLKDAATYSRPIFLIAWAQTLILVPLFRAMARAAFAGKSWWGYPVILLGSARAASAVAATLDRGATLGLKPVASFDDPELAASFARQRRIRHAILVMEETTRHSTLAFFNLAANVFSEVIVVPDLAGFSSLWVEARDLNGVLGLQVHQRLLAIGPRSVKRAVDLCAVIAGGVVALPIAIAIAAAIKLTSPGPVFYRQVRMGRAGRPFTAWKFRSMVDNASAAFEECLRRDADVRREWQERQKLRDDPRITPVGRFLRRTSLDELPQFWNIFLGQMSLVGPRPILDAETSRYGDGYALYKKVTPGLTGLWQVSGRNELSYQERVDLDLYYIRNWSPWLDLYILARTITAVVLARGAY